MEVMKQAEMEIKHRLINYTWHKSTTNLVFINVILFKSEMSGILLNSLKALLNSKLLFVLPVNKT